MAPASAPAKALRLAEPAFSASSLFTLALGLASAVADLLAGAPTNHLPEIRSLLWRWNASEGPGGVTIGRQRLTTSGSRSIGSFSWFPDMQVFDGVRVDLGREKDFGRFSLGAFIDEAFVSPFHAGPSVEDEPFLLAAWSWKNAGFGTCHAHARFNPGREGSPWLGASWERSVGKGRETAAYRVDALALAGGENEEATPWHVSFHRQKKVWGLHAGAERIVADEAGRYGSATPGTFRYLPDGIQDDTLNLFFGFDYRMNQGAMASITMQHLEERLDGAADVIEAAIRHAFSPSAAVIAGAGCGRDQESGDVVFRSGVQILAVF